MNALHILKGQHRKMSSDRERIESNGASRLNDIIYDGLPIYIYKFNKYESKVNSKGLMYIYFLGVACTLNVHSLNE